MINCEDLTRLVSESMERNLSLRQRIGVRVHLSMCTFCRRFKEQVSFMRELVDLYKTAVENDYAIDNRVTLSVEFRENVKKLLRNN